MPSPISLADARLAWHQHVDAVNLLNPPKVYTRISPKGLEQTIIIRPRTVCDGAKTSGEMLIQRARKATQRLAASPFLFDVMVTDTGQQAPRIEVNAHELGQKRSLTKKTIRRHLQELTDAGLIIHKKTHGWQKNIELWINPDFVWEKAQNPVEKQTTADSGVHTIGSILASEGIKCPPIEVLETTRNLTVIVGDCGKLSDCPTGNSLTGNGGLRDSLPTRRRTSKERHQGGGAAPTTPNLTADEVLAQQLKVAQNKAYCVSAWEYMKALIYQGPKWQGYRWSPEQERKALNAMWDGVYLGFRDPNCDYAAYHQQVLRRVELVQIYFRDHAAKGYYAPLPYSELLPGKGYLDAENVHGFAGTAAWYRNDVQRRRKNELEMALVAGVSELKQRYRFDRLGEKAKVPRRIQNHTLLQLHQHHHRIIERLGGSNGLYRFAHKLNQLKIIALPAQNSSIA